VRIPALLASLLVYTAAVSAQCPKNSDHCVTTVQLNEGGGTTTSAVYDNREHAEVVGEATRQIVGAGLNYLLITRPQIEAERNLRANRLEGQFTPVYELLDSLSSDEVPGSPIPGTSSQKIKGYHLGETWSDFLADSPLLRERSAKCDTEKRPNLEGRRKKVEFNPCSTLWLLNDNSTSDVTFTCLETNLGAGKDMICHDFNGEVGFHEGRLASLKLILSGDWTEVRPDIIEKFGEPDGQDSEKTIGIWNTSNSHLVATEVDAGSALAWMTAGRYHAAVNLKKQLAEPKPKTAGNSLN
jgi:hypothetical protein